jgi:Txe/YoeB family toxin of Txe-Axe toxin-antitoxin module
VHVRPSHTDAHEIVFFKRHREDDPTEEVPARAFLRQCPHPVRAKFNAILTQVAAAPPHRFSGGGYWEAMHGDMTGWYEVRVNGAHRHHYRLFCRLDYDAAGVSKPLLVVIAGKDKPFRTVLSPADYAEVRTLGDEYLARNPRSKA